MHYVHAFHNIMVDGEDDIILQGKMERPGLWNDYIYRCTIVINSTTFPYKWLQ